MAWRANCRGRCTPGACAVGLGVCVARGRCVRLRLHKRWTRRKPCCGRLPNTHCGRARMWLRSRVGSTANVGAGKTKSIVQLRALNAHVRAQFRWIQIQPGHGRHPRSISYELPNVQPSNNLQPTATRATTHGAAPAPAISYLRPPPSPLTPPTRPPCLGVPSWRHQGGAPLGTSRRARERTPTG